MQTSINIKGQEYKFVKKAGMEDEDGNIIIPKEYERIESITNNLFAGIEETLGNGLMNLSEGKLVEKSRLTYSTLEVLWEQVNKFKRENGSVESELLIRNMKLKVAARRIDFFSLKGKLKINKKILAYYYSVVNEVLLLMDDNYKWCLATVDYDNQEIVISEVYSEIERIKEIPNEGFILEKDSKFEIIYANGQMNIGPFCGWIAVETFDKGFIVVDKEGDKGFYNYSGKKILDVCWKKIIPQEDYIEVYTKKKLSGELKGIYSYCGKRIVPCEYIKIDTYSNLYIARGKTIEGEEFYELFSNEARVSAKVFSDIKINGDIIIYAFLGKYAMGSYYSEEGHMKAIIPLEYDSLRFSKLNENYICAKKGKKYALFDINGNQITGFRHRFFMSRETKKYFEE